MLRIWLFVLLSGLSVALGACGTLHEGDPRAFRTTIEGIRPNALQ